MQKIDWLRDMEEAQAYPEAKVVLREWTDSYSSTIVKVMETFTDRRDVGWMPVDCAHYNQWKAERGKKLSQLPDLDDFFYENDCPECEGTGIVETVVRCGYVHSNPCPTCNGTGTIDKKEERHAVDM